MTELKLASGFPAASREDWLKLVGKVLKGAPFETLVSKTQDGIAIEPIYPRAASARAVPGRAPGEPWQVMQRADHPEPAAANKLALEDLQGGATALSLVFAGSVGAYGYGVGASEDALAKILDGIHLDAIGIECQLSSPGRDAPKQIAKLIKRRGIDPARVNFRVGFDPLGLMAVAGGHAMTWDKLAPFVGQYVQDLLAEDARGKFMVADGRVVHNAGGSEAQELAFALAAAIAYLRLLESTGVSLGDARRMIFFRLSTDSEQFLTMAKFRAIRKLWARVEEASGLMQEPVFISAETAWRTMTKRDPHVNMLRVTMAVAAAGLGGADAIAALPFTNAIGLPDEFARRIARNTQLILLEESSLAKVGDPAAGSGGIEDLTEKLCAAAWAQLQEIERAGGLAAALERGELHKQIAKVREARLKALKDGEDVLTGTTIFPNPGEAPAKVLDVPRAALPEASKSVNFEALKPARLAEAFE